MTRSLRWIATAFLVLLVGAVVCWWIWSSWQLSKARRAWLEAYPQLAGEMSRRLASPANETALKLEREAALLGLNWAPKTSPRFSELAKSISEEAEKQFSAVRPALSKWVEKQLGASPGNEGGAPQEVAVFLQCHQDHITTLRHLLLNDPAPHWEEDPSAGWAAPVPNLLTSLAVVRILAADALWNIQQNSQTVAQQDLLAIRRLAQTLVDRSELISVLVGMHMTRLVVTGIRQLTNPDTSWLDWLEGLDVAPKLERSFVSEAYLFAFGCPPFPEEERKSFFDPWQKSRCAQVSQLFLAFARLAREKPCLGGSQAEEPLRAPGWMENPESSWFVPNLRSALTRLQALHVHASLTREVLLARLGRKTPAAGTITVDRGPCRGLPLEVTQAGSSWSWGLTGKEPELPEAWLPLAATLR